MRGLNPSFANQNQQQGVVGAYGNLEKQLNYTKPKPKNLDPMSVEDLAEYIEELKAEIRRVEENMQKKKAHLSAAAGLFKS